MSPLSPPTDALEQIEITLLLEGVYQHYGHDFRGYAPGTVRRRVLHCLQAERLPTVSALQDRVLHDPAAMTRLVAALSIQVTEMFRDPSFYRALREQVLPVLRTHPFLRVWHAGCSTGEEVYSLAILLEEAGLLSRTRLYATDVSAPALAVARQGIYSAEKLAGYARNYTDAGGARSFSAYFTQGQGHALVSAPLRQNVIWGQHNLVTDGSFNEFHLILCRNVMIYFARPLQEQVQGLLHASLVTFGVLGLGQHETLEFSPHSAHFETLNYREKLYRRIA
ncbi:CheR family methyltransferase [Deinococcus hopiensis]|uniref:Chemotaxis protein methyltransferase CheR n=1 Tax=Deinococcus hopiensis KR-140 TaxID=695939 RepID=A0A1W1UHD4_9DEIO|nr:protein-glutamate O-methyltransferase CheR [Deinococcus hopiensis]SMB80184.1 chemotaxis protein methyltransferase CheR [Deinococcus hopiensis KR-140]